MNSRIFLILILMFLMIILLSYVSWSQRQEVTQALEQANLMQLKYRTDYTLLSEKYNQLLNASHENQVLRNHVLNISLFSIPKLKNRGNQNPVEYLIENFGNADMIYLKNYEGG